MPPPHTVGLVPLQLSCANGMEVSCQTYSGTAEVPMYGLTHSLSAQDAISFMCQSVSPASNRQSPRFGLHLTPNHISSIGKSSQPFNTTNTNSTGVLVCSGTMGPVGFTKRPTHLQPSSLNHGTNNESSAPIPSPLPRRPLVPNNLSWTTPESYQSNALQRTSPMAASPSANMEDKVSPARSARTQTRSSRALNNENSKQDGVTRNSFRKLSPGHIISHIFWCLFAQAMLRTLMKSGKDFCCE